MANLALISKVFEESYRERCAPKLDWYYPYFFNQFYLGHWDYWYLNGIDVGNEYLKYLTMFPSFDIPSDYPIFGNGGAHSQTPWQNNCWLNESRLQPWMDAKALSFSINPTYMAWYEAVEGAPIWYEDDIFAALNITEWAPLERMKPPSRKWWKQMHDIHQLVGTKQIFTCSCVKVRDTNQSELGMWWYSMPGWPYAQDIKFPAKTEYWALSNAHTGMADGWSKIAEYAHGVTPPVRSYITGQGYLWVYLIIDYADAWQYYPAVRT